MNNKNQGSEHAGYPDISSDNPFYTPPQPQPSSHPPPPSNEQTPGNHQVSTPATAPQASASNQNAEKWGTHVMGTPAVPTCHPNNQKAALWGASATDQKDYQNHHQPYIQYTPIDKHTGSPFDSVLQKFNSWSAKAESTAHNIWHNLKTGTSVSEAAWGKMNLTAKTITGGGFEALYKQTFSTHPNEVLKKTFACYLSTSTGPVAGTLYLSNVHVAFCSDRPLSFTAPSGQQTWSYYKILLPLAKIGSIHPVIMGNNSTERYIQVVSVDGHDFWFMGFVNYEKASHHLFEAVSSYAAGAAAGTGIGAPPMAQPYSAQQHSQPPAGAAAGTPPMAQPYPAPQHSQPSDASAKH